MEKYNSTRYLKLLKPDIQAIQGKYKVTVGIFYDVVCAHGLTIQISKRQMEFRGILLQKLFN
ncbi:MAG: hypothetical protein ACJ718_07765 [Nitrososphaeraceae archaeon]